jgi:hypothetical protein
MKKSTLLTLPIFLGIGMLNLSCNTPPSRKTSPPPNRAFEIVKFEAVWMPHYDGSWRPVVKMTINNVGKDDFPTGTLYFKVLFSFTEEGLTKGDEIVEQGSPLLAGYANDIEVSGKKGYFTDTVFPDMREDPSKMWRYTLYDSATYFGPWNEVQSGVVELPKPFQ